MIRFDHVTMVYQPGARPALDDVSLEVKRGEFVFLVGKSGSGKSTFLQLTMREIRATSGTVWVLGHDVGKLSRWSVPKLRRQVGTVFQDFRLLPSKSVYENVALAMQVIGKPRHAIETQVPEVLELVGLAGKEKRLPHELSGGMRQRIVIAMALACSPKLIIADEPTTALDVTIQAQILDLLRGLKDKINSSIMLITHDLGVIAEMADYVVVMYSGRVVEAGTAKEIFSNPSHPYTIGLMASKPVVGKHVDKLYSIPGKVPNPINMPNYCYFRDRCDKRKGCCDGAYPGEISLSETHRVSCYLYDEEARK
mgnify:CR=1 FL=1